MTKTKKDNAHTKDNAAHTEPDAEAVEATYSAVMSADANRSIGGDGSLSLVFPEPDLTGAMGVNVADVPANPNWDVFPVRWRVPTPPLPLFKNSIGNISGRTIIWYLVYLSIGGLCCYLGVEFHKAFIQEVDWEVSQMVIDISLDVSRCKYEYELNKCALGIPALKDRCASWESCMKVNVDNVPRLRAGVHVWFDLLGMGVQDFLRNLDLLGMIYSLLALVIVLWLRPWEKLSSR